MEVPDHWSESGRAGSVAKYCRELGYHPGVHCNRNSDYRHCGVQHGFSGGLQRHDGRRSHDRHGCPPKDRGVLPRVPERKNAPRFCVSGKILHKSLYQPDFRAECPRRVPVLLPESRRDDRLRWLFPAGRDHFGAPDGTSFSGGSGRGGRPCGASGLSFGCFPDAGMASEEP